MNIGFWMCIELVPIFFLISLVFAILKGKAAKFVSGFNSLPKSEQELYDKDYIARDNRNSFFIWAIIMLIGAISSYFLTPFLAIAAYIVWGILFFREVHFDIHKAFEEYLRK